MRISPFDVLAAFAALHGAAAQQFIPNLQFDITVDNMHGMFRWLIPERRTERNEATGIIPWAVDYPQTATFTPGTIGTGDPVHFVTGQWFDPNNVPTFKFTFPGRGFKVGGTFTPWNATVASDVSPIVLRTDQNVGFISDFSNGLGSNSDLAWGHHDVNYTINYPQYSGGANWTVTDVTMSTGMVSNAPSLDKVPKVVKSFVVNGQPNSDFVWLGNWAVRNSLGGVAGQDSVPYDYMYGVPPVGPALNAANNITFVFIDIPLNTSFVMVNGSMGPLFDTFFALWEPVSALGVSPQIAYPYSLWNVPNAIMFFQTLNPEVHYNVSIAVPTKNTGLGISSITFYSALYDGPDAIDKTVAVAPTNTSSGSSGPTSPVPADQDATKKKKTNVGAIAGGVVGGVLGLLLLGLLVFCLVRRRKKPSKHDADNSRFVVDDNPGNVVSPFVTSQQNQQMQQNQPLLQSTLAQPQHSPVTQTYNVQGTGGGFTTNSFTTGSYAGGGGYPENAITSNSALETPSTGVMPLLSTHRSTSDVDESSSVSPSMSASMSGINGEGKSPGTPGIAAFSPYYGPGAHTPQTFPVSALEKSRSATAAQQPITQELDAGAVSQYGTVPPVYDHRWTSPSATSATSPLENVAHHTGSAVGADHTLAHTATGPSGQRPSVQSVDSFADDASYRTPPEH